jgi:ParB/RepB/Spo0J family partition protein
MSATEIEETKNLCETLKADGQLQPIEVEEIGNGSYLLIFGNRRRCAAKLAGWTEIEATIRPSSTDNERMIRNILENVKRRNLTSFEEARACAAMRKTGLSLKDVSAKLGFSVPKVSNLAVTFDTLPEPIIKEWRDNNPVATNEFLRDLATDKKYPTAEEKMKAWDERVRVLAERQAEADAGNAPEGEEGETEPGEGSGTSGFPVSQKRIAWLVDVLTSKKGSPDLKDDVRNGYRALVAYVIQQRETPPEGVPPMPVKVKPVPLTEEEKAVKKAKAQAESAAKKAAELATKAADLAAGKTPVAKPVPPANGKKAPLALAPQVK